MLIVHKLDPTTATLLIRLLDIYEGRQQVRIDTATERLRSSRERLNAVIKSTVPTK